MGVTRKVLKPGNSNHKPRKGDEVTVEYTGNFYDEAKGEMADYRGAQFDSSADHGGFKIAIGVGKAIKGWDEGVMKMSLGEQSILTITSDYTYGTRGFPDLIPPNSDLVFEVQLIGINNMTF